MTQEMFATDEQVVGIAQDVWSSFTGKAVEAAPDGVAPAGGAVLVGCVTVTGDWHGCVLLACPEPLARAAAAAMFDRPAGSLTDDEVADALGELTNMVGGNLKSLLPGSSRLSMPAVTVGAPSSVPPPGAELLTAVSLACEGLPLTVYLYRGNSQPTMTESGSRVPPAAR